MRHIIFFTLTFLLLTSFSQSVFAQKDQKEQEEVMHIVQQFFQALEKHDSSTFRQIFLPDSYNYYVLKNQDSVRIGNYSPLDFNFRKGRIIKERFRENTVDIKIDRSIAMVWGAYDLWVNDKFSHCGIDVFTLLKTGEGWKISSLSYSIEKESCE